MSKHLLFFLLVIGGFLNSVAQTYYSDVAPIFYSRCASCHNNNSHGPPLLNYSQTYAKKNLIATHLSSGYMPPWPPDTTYTRFLHEELISAAERTAILDWISAGALAGDTTLAPPAPSYPQYMLSGTPDAVLQIPTFVSNANTTDSYVCFALPTGLTQDRVLRAYEIVAGNPSIVHHVVVNVDTTGNVSSDLSGYCYTISGQFSIGGYAPGSPPTVFPGVAPLKAGIRIKSGSKLVLQIHYPSGTAGETDSTKIRLYYYPVGTTGIRPVYVSTPLQNWSLNIPAGTVKPFTAMYPTNSSTLPIALSMYAAFPHSHKLATSIVNYAYTSTDTIPLIRINKWDFNWQGYYTFKNLVKVPAGYKLYSKHIYDNTVNNPDNPNSPPIAVYDGPNTGDEMLFDSFQYLLYQSGDENIDINSLLANDTLLMASIKENNFSSSQLSSYAYPNPFENSVKIAYFLESPSKVAVEIYSVYGVLVKTIQTTGIEFSGRHELTWDGKNAEGAAVSAGNYFYIIKAGSKQNNGKLSLQH